MNSDSTLSHPPIYTLHEFNCIIDHKKNLRVDTVLHEGSHTWRIAPLAISGPPPPVDRFGIIQFLCFKDASQGGNGCCSGYRWKPQVYDILFADDTIKPTSHPQHYLWLHLPSTFWSSNVMPPFPRLFLGLSPLPPWSPSEPLE